MKKVSPSFSITEGAIAGLRFTKQFSGSDSGVRGTDLFFENPDPATHAGYYHCTAENPSGIAKSHVIFVSEEPRNLPDDAVL